MKPCKKWTSLPFAGVKYAGALATLVQVEITNISYLPYNKSFMFNLTEAAFQ